jgi:hypothetical protein
LGGEVASRAGTNNCDLVVRQLPPNYLSSYFLMLLHRYIFGGDERI